MDSLTAAAQDVITRGMPLTNMCPAYRPQNDWVAGFAVVELDADGYYRVDNRKIIDGRIV